MWIITVEQTVEGFLLIAIVSELSIPVEYEREKLAGSDE